MNWVYDINSDNTVRFTLGEYENKSERTLICFGINPSTASPQNLDNTVKKVKVLSQNNGYKNWIMLNIYPQRATNPNDLHSECDKNLCKLNLDYIEKILSEFNHSDILFAYGNLITKRKYLTDSLNGIIALIKSLSWNGSCLCIKLTKNGHPIHPLYQNNNSKFIFFSI